MHFQTSTVSKNHKIQAFTSKSDIVDIINMSQMPPQKIQLSKCLGEYTHKVPSQYKVHNLIAVETMPERIT